MVVRSDGQSARVDAAAIRRQRRNRPGIKRHLPQRGPGIAVADEIQVHTVGRHHRTVVQRRSQRVRTVRAPGSSGASHCDNRTGCQCHTAQVVTVKHVAIWAYNGERRGRIKPGARPRGRVHHPACSARLPTSTPRLGTSSPSSTTRPAAPASEHPPVRPTNLPAATTKKRQAGRSWERQLALHAAKRAATAAVSTVPELPAADARHPRAWYVTAQAGEIAKPHLPQPVRWLLRGSQRGPR